MIVSGPGGSGQGPRDPGVSGLSLSDRGQLEYRRSASGIGQDVVTVRTHRECSSDSLLVILGPVHLLGYERLPDRVVMCGVSFVGVDANPLALHFRADAAFALNLSQC